MADLVPLGAVPDATEILALLVDLKRRLEAGEDTGSRVAQIREVAAAMRASTGGLRRALEEPGASLEAAPTVVATARRILVLAEQNVATVEGLLRLVEEQDLRPTAGRDPSKGSD